MRKITSVLQCLEQVIKPCLVAAEADSPEFKDGTVDAERTKMILLNVFK